MNESLSVVDLENYVQLHSEAHCESGWNEMEADEGALIRMLRTLWKD